MEIADKALKYTFSGHDTFSCRHFWLKKGYDYLNSGRSFSREDAVVDLGVGKNMVAAIRFWMKAFDLVDAKEKPTALADNLFGENGWDPYLEDEGSLWLLHYHLIKKGFASSYQLIFNELRREKVEFSKANYINYLKRKVDASGPIAINEKTVADDFNVFVRMYLRSDLQSKDKEDLFSGLLTELDLVKAVNNRNNDVFAIANEDRKTLPAELVLYVLLDQSPNSLSISLNTAEQDYGNVGAVFALNRTGLTNKVDELLKKYKTLSFSDNSGIRELQLKKEMSGLDILRGYYAAN